LTLGLALRRRDVPVTVWEAGRYPRHRVCGEFISGRGQDALQRLGLLERLTAAGARPARTAAFGTARRMSPALPLPRPALCLSREILDALLAGEFRRAGGDLREGARWRDATEQPGVVRASGRSVCAEAGGWRWFGLKAHARGVALRADLELHVARDGYVGLCGLGGNIVNVCGLFRSRTALPDLAQRWRTRLCGGPGTPLGSRLADAEWDEGSFCAVAGLSLEPLTATGRAECVVGDALTMIAPATGNGMSMAFESAELAVEPLAAWSAGVIPWTTAVAGVADGCDRRFQRRLRWSARLQRACFSGSPPGEWLLHVLRLPLAWRAAFAWTR
jgi:2-polyprenyl-6-methoxyphenol hydroxylase-like FAD-dependent oxidoreductase